MSSRILFPVLSIFLWGSLTAAFPFNNLQDLERPNYDNIPQCDQPSESGMCYAYFTRYHYNASAGACQEFIYGGCAGNLNNFDTVETCMQTCGNTTSNNTAIEPKSQPAEQNVCSLAKDSGLCYGNHERYHFNGEKCEVFTYGGCGGNGNNFETEEACSKACPSKVEKAARDKK